MKTLRADIVKLAVLCVLSVVATSVHALTTAGGSCFASASMTSFNGCSGAWGSGDIGEKRLTHVQAFASALGSDVLHYVASFNLSDSFGIASGAIPVPPMTYSPLSATANKLFGLYEVAHHWQQRNEWPHVVATPPIPEPETYALMLAGLAVVGFIARRRMGRG